MKFGEHFKVYTIKYLRVIEFIDEQRSFRHALK